MLSIFMGGLALGAYLTSRLSSKIKNPLLTYAVVEVVIGIFALFFHEIFIISNDFLFNYLAPNIDSSTLFTVIKWSLCILLILPQSILLGTTFPLISTGILKLSHQQPGEKISLLYFNNSFGAALGALVSGFYLIQTFGLSGTITIAGLMNILIGIIVFLIVKNIYVLKSKPEEIATTINKNIFYYLMLGTAFFTGMASFFYEIAWIRMLTLVLGATTHAFELMISAFILGLALGSLWIKKRIDKFKSPVTILAYVQILMASFALLTLVFYENLFDLMEFTLKVINRNEDGYGIYLFIKHLFSLLLMLPATFCAGMTLPLVTNILLKKTNNKNVIGQVYATNTLGAIIGIILAMNFLLPAVGIKGVISLGGLIDIAIGLLLFGFLLYQKSNKTTQLQLLAIGVFSFGVFQLTYHFSSLESHKLSSGVFRTGIASLDKETEILFHRDGKLSTVNVIQTKNDTVVIYNNGKPDAGINVYGSSGSVDEVTMILAGAFPFAINPKIKTVANIGMGSGQTAQTLLSYPSIEKVDTIEIEEGVIEALPLFEIFSRLPRYDERSNIIIDDAKTFFASSKTKYDLIISEPPNLWVSGVSSLFTSEFYSRIKKKLAKDGFFTQWIHLYEINIKSVVSILKSLSENFNDYVLYNTDDGNILIIAADNLNINNLHEDFLSNKKIKKLLQRIKIKSTDSLYMRYLGNKELFTPLLNSYNIEPASDYYPRLAYDAAKSFFLLDNAKSLTSLHNYSLPIHKILSGSSPRKTLNVLNEPFFATSRKINLAKEILKDFTKTHKFKPQIYSQELRYSLKIFHHQLFQCSKNRKNKIIDNDIIIDSAYKIASATTSFLGTDDLEMLWKTIHQAPCYNDLNWFSKTWLGLHKELATHNFKKAFPLAKRLFESPAHFRSAKLKEYLFASVLISAVKTNNKKYAQQVWLQYAKKLFKAEKNIPLSLRLLHAHFKN